MLKLNEPVAGLSLPSAEVMVELVLDKLTLVPNEVLDPNDSEALLPLCTVMFTVSPFEAATGVGSAGICCDQAGEASETTAKMLRKRGGRFIADLGSSDKATLVLV